MQLCREVDEDGPLGQNHGDVAKKVMDFKRKSLEASKLGKLEDLGDGDEGVASVSTAADGTEASYSTFGYASTMQSVFSTDADFSQPVAETLGGIFRQSSGNRLGERKMRHQASDRKLGHQGTGALESVQESITDHHEEDGAMSSSQGASNVPSAPPGSFEFEDLPSVGSKDHSTGRCRPCAWFWKPSSCSNGRECFHCHLCPAGELRNRKVRRNQADTETAAPSKGSKEPPFAKDSLDTAKEDETQNLGPPPGLATGPVSTSTSVGSSKHATRECRPCAWYWKPGSCANGEECLHCHLCPEDEIKRRKKAKMDSLRPNGSSTTEEKEASALHKTGGSLKSRQQSESARGSSSSPSPATFREATFLPSMESLDEAMLPSPGSHLHHLGKCKPCAWFWKPGSCTNGKECCHCHLCPESELKDRRKAKESAMRAGALQPNAATDHARNMHMLKIFPLL